MQLQRLRRNKLWKNIVLQFVVKIVEPLATCHMQQKLPYVKYNMQ